MHSVINQPNTQQVTNSVNPRSPGIHPSAYSFTKRLIDIIGALVGLMICGLVFVPIAIAIKLDSPGSIVFKQKRYGLQGQPFEIYKFRSMIEGADALKEVLENEAQGPIFKNRHDPRITRLGRFLRSSSLDELPQFLNVLRGEMSLVGTRPPTADEVVQYESHQWRRLAVKPGITGVWQVSGRSSIETFDEILKLDMHYQARWSPAYDIKIIWRTVAAVLNRANAW